MSETPVDNTWWNARISLVKEIALLNELVVKYSKDDPLNLLNTTSVRLAEAHFQLYEFNKAYDRELDARVNPIEPEKTFWQKLLRK